MAFRLKIVLWFSFAVLFMLVGVHLASIAVVRLMIYDELDNSLEGEARWLNDILVTYQARGVPDQDIRAEIHQRSSLNPRKEFISIWTAEGNLYLNSKNLGEESLPRPDNFLQPVTLKGFHDQDVRLIGTRNHTYTIAIGYSLADAESAIRNIIFASNILLPVTVLLSLLGGFFLVGRLLRPVKQINQFLAAAATHPLSRELPGLHIQENDEMGELGRRVSDAVGKMRTSMRWILSYSTLVPHQLRTPVAVMRNQMENAMHERATRAQLQQAVASTYDEILKLNDSIDNLLALGKLQAGTLRLDIQKVRLRNFLEAFRDEAHALAGTKSVVFRLDEGPDILLTADMQWIRQALFNLLDNAIRHTPEGGQITLRYAVDGSMIDVTLSDTGVGIPAAEIPWLFEPFFQGESRDRNAPGNGLGLVLVKLIATAHHGSVRVESNPGKGATFTLSLPLHPESGASENNQMHE